MTRKQKKLLYRIIAGAVLFIIAFVLSKTVLADSIFALFPYLAAYAVIGWDVVWRAIRNILHGQVFDENFLMTLATVGAFATGEYPEGAAVMLFYQIGELFQSYAVGKSRKSIASLMDIRPETANLERDGDVVEVDPSEVPIGSIINVKPGERVPIDGVVVEGSSFADMSALTGESVPVEISEGDDVISGSVNGSGVLHVRTTKAYADSTVARILELVENASAKKAKAENFITKFARVYTPAVVIAAVLLAVIPPLVLRQSFNEWIYRALSFLVISCPCALVISVPMSFFGGIGAAGKKGVLIKGGCYIESLAKTSTVVFDKTGTLTRGVFGVTAIHPDRVSGRDLLEIAAHVEAYSDHPIAISVKRAYGSAIDRSRVTDVKEIAGKGLSAVIDGHDVAVGNDKLMEDIGCSWHPCHKVGTTVHVALDGAYMGHIVISDEIKEGSAEAMKQLKSLGVKETVMLTGDAEDVASEVAKTVGIDKEYAKLMPGDKVNIVEELLEKKSDGTSLAFVGDGINDAPVLSRADIGIAMGGIGSDAAIEAADVVLMDDDPRKIADAIRISRKTLSIVNQNIVFALAVKALVLILGALGYANMWEAVFADVGVSVIAILNAMRAMKS